MARAPGLPAARVRAEFKEVAQTLNEIGKGWDVDAAASRGRCLETLENAHDLRRRHAYGDGVQRYKASGKVAANDEGGRFRNPALLACVIDVPGLNGLSFCVAQDGERQTYLATQSFGYFRRVNRNGDKGRAGCADFFIMIAKVRQLAEAERSPRPTIEDEHHGATRY